MHNFVYLIQILKYFILGKYEHHLKKGTYFFLKRILMLALLRVLNYQQDEINREMVMCYVHIPVKTSLIGGFLKHGLTLTVYVRLYQIHVTHLKTQFL